MVLPVLEDVVSILLAPGSVPDCSNPHCSVLPLTLCYTPSGTHLLSDYTVWCGVLKVRPGVLSLHGPQAKQAKARARQVGADETVGRTRVRQTPVSDKQHEQHSVPNSTPTHVLAAGPILALPPLPRSLPWLYNPKLTFLALTPSQSLAVPTGPF